MDFKTGIFFIIKELPLLPSFFNMVSSWQSTQEHQWVTTFLHKLWGKLSKSVDKSWQLLQVEQLIVNIGKLGFLNKSDTLNSNTEKNLQLQQLLVWWLTWSTTTKDMDFQWVWCFQELMKMDLTFTTSILKEAESKEICSVLDQEWHMLMVFLILSTDTICQLKKLLSWEEKQFITPQTETQVQVVLWEFSMYIKEDGLKK